MASIEVDRRIMEALDSQAQLMGPSIGDYLKLFIPTNTAVSPVPPEESERLLNELLFSGPSLPPDFSRADIYDSHDSWPGALINTGSPMGVAVHDARLVATMNFCGVRNLLTLYPSDFRRYPGIRVETPEGIIAASSTSKP